MSQGDWNWGKPQWTSPQLESKPKSTSRGDVNEADPLHLVTDQIANCVDQFTAKPDMIVLADPGRHESNHHETHSLHSAARNVAFTFRTRSELM